MKKERSILKSTLWVTLFSFVIKFLGLIKQSVIATICGATMETDAFFIASGILISLCIVLFSAISISLLSMYTEKVVKKGEENARALIHDALCLFMPLAILISITVFLFSDQIGRLLAPQYQEDQIRVLSQYIQIMSAVFVIWCYFMIINVILEAEKIFLPGKMQAFFQNILLIVAVFFFYPKFGILSLLMAFLISGISESILVTWLARKSLSISFRGIINKQEVKQLLKLSVPLMVGNAVYEINDIVDKRISVGLGAGQASYLNYGATINEIVTGIVVASVSTVMFSHYATWIAQGELERIKNGIQSVIEILTILILPIMVICFLDGEKIVAVLYQRGNFGVRDVHFTYGVVCGYAVGFIFQSVRANLTKVLYAFQNTRAPLVNGVISVSCNIMLSILLSKSMGVAGIALATSLAMLLSSILLFLDVKKYLPTLTMHSSLCEVVKGVFASLIIGMVICMMHAYMHVNIYLTVLFDGFIGILIYVLLMLVLKSRCIENVLQYFHKKENK
ncbi:MAG: murein biosynthesis integral membrane protein MurJ [Lachnospiraceae bacterium]|nr:murein biosynthesis integral membrane protein MurJ [Lachnospiraceae bacterium]MBR4607848.1 murein biosynthesis integral membrane protein MurJ [Lachnospiraceae bacterium]MBR6149882.1 murein biosynthesis integral membrane protein MurJ [Lachnospiraceae bacterium]